MKRSICLASLAFLCGCAGSAEPFPSLAVRPYEVDLADVARRQTPAPPPAPAVALPASQRQSLASALAQHRAADTEFRAALPGVRRAVDAAAGQSVGAESWVVAQQALSRLEVLRSPSIGALADIDALAIERLAAQGQGVGSGDAGALGAARAAVAAAVSDQSAILSGLARRIG